MAEDCVECGCADGSLPVMPPSSTAAPCVNPEPCSYIYSAGCIQYNGANILCGTDVVATSGDRLTQVITDVVTYFCTRLSAALFGSITYAGAEGLIADEQVVPGMTYFISDVGIYLTGLTTTSFSSSGSRIMRIVRGTYYQPDTGILGVWHPGLTPAVGNVVVWGGRVWQNLTGAVGSATNQTSLDLVNWVMIATTNNTYYENKTFSIEFDFANNWISQQSDDKRNIFGVSYFQGSFLGFNPVDISDWGYPTFSPLMVGNNCWGVYNNLGDVTHNKNNGTIYRNLDAVSQNRNIGSIYVNVSSVVNNANLGDIKNNQNTGGISNNTNKGSIEDLTSNVTFVENNSNSGEISSCDNVGSIDNNRNNGSITGITDSTTDITHNINNGNISTPTVGPITDTIVNK